MPKCILIVDDHEHIRKIIRSVLEKESGFDVCGEAVDGFDAIDKAQELKPDLILLDMSMPRMNGIEAAPQLKKLLPQTPIVLFTSHGPLVGFNARAVGIDAVIAKNAGMTTLIENLQNLLQEA